MAKYGINIIGDFFQRDHSPRETMWVMIAKGEARTFLETYSELAKTSAQAAGFLNSMGAGYSIRFVDVAGLIASKGIDPAITAVEARKTGVEPAPGGNPPPIKKVAISGVGVFKKDKLIGWLNTKEARGLMWVKNMPMKGVIIIPSPGEPDKKVSIRIRGNNAKIEPEYDGENIRFKVKIRVEGDLVEQQSIENLATPEKIKDLEKLMANDVKKRVNNTIRKCQNLYGTDIFGFGEAFHRKYKKEWREIKDIWNDEFARADIQVEVKAKIREIGIITERPVVSK